MSDCLFCKIVEGEIPSFKVYEDELTYGFLDIFPASKGHTLVIPKSHHQDVFDISSSLYAKVAQSAQAVAALLESKLKCDGISVMQSNRQAAWQTVFHLHFHVIPRWSGDALINPWTAKPADAKELEGIWALLK